MSELSREALRVIELGKDGQGPTAAQRERVRAGVAAGVAALGVTAGAGSAAAAATGVASAGGTAAATTATGSLLGIKIAIATVVAVGAGVGGASVAIRASSPPEVVPAQEIAVAAGRRPGAEAVVVPRLERASPAAAAPEAAKPVRKNVNRAPETGNRKPEAGNEHAETEAVLPPTPNPQLPTPPAPPPPTTTTERTTARRGPPALDEQALMAIAIDANRRRDYPSVLAATAMHAARYLRSSRALDRDTLRAIALCQTGRQEEGRWVLGRRRWLSLSPGRVNEILAACDVEREDE